MTDRPSTDWRPPPRALKVQRHDAGGEVVLEPHGEVDLATADVLDRHLQDAQDLGPSQIVLDLAGVTFMDTNGLRVLLQAKARAEDARSELVIRGAPLHIQRVFEIAGIAEHFAFERK